jgi:hypothetical protein
MLWFVVQSNKHSDCTALSCNSPCIVRLQHAYDYPDPSVASQGLSAGIRLADIASASCHAIHMKSHLCKWDTSVGNLLDSFVNRTTCVSISKRMKAGIECLTLCAVAGVAL